jgi:sister-chromatid-cohesion protein PDS5
LDHARQIKFCFSLFIKRSCSKIKLTCLICTWWFPIGLGHIAYLIPHLVAKEMKDFVVTAIAKDLLLKPATAPLNISSSEMPAANSSNAERRKKDLKLAGKWCEDEDELPFNTRARIEGVKLITRWCLGLRSECTNITVSLRLLTKLIKDNSLVEHTDHSDETLVHVSESERSRVRSVCGNQLLKLAQENCFKPLVTAEYFHVLSRLVIDPVTNVRDILIKKLNKGIVLKKFYYYKINNSIFTGRLSFFCHFLNPPIIKFNKTISFGFLFQY